MRPIRTIGPYLVVALTLSAFIASAAAAAPSGPYFRIKYTEGAKKGLEDTLGANTGEAETLKVKARMKAGTVSQLDIPALSLGFECTSATGAGEIYDYYGSPTKRMEGRLKKSTVNFSGCKVVGDPVCEVKSPKGVSGEIQVEAVRARLGFKPVSNEKEREEGKGVELELIPETSTVTTIDVFECGGFEGAYKITGKLIATAGSPIDKFGGAIVAEAKINAELQELKEISFSEYNEETNKLELEDVKNELKFGTHSAALASTLEFYEPKLGSEAVEVGIYTR